MDDGKIVCQTFGRPINIKGKNICSAQICLKLKTSRAALLSKLNNSIKASGGSFLIMHYLDHVLIKIIIKERKPLFIIILLYLETQKITLNSLQCY
jgi:hypothetical protein